MRQLTLIEANTLRWLDVPEPRLTSGHAAIVRPIAVAVCDFDRAVITGRYPALTHPIAVGHEIVAEVIEVGSQVHTVSIGMQVILPLHISCGSCPSCRIGHTNSCNARPPLSNYGLGSRGGDWGGGMSDLLLVPYADAMAVPKPANLSAADCAAIGCNLVDMYRTVAPYIATLTESRILIVGGMAHNMALYGVVIAQALGVQRIDFLDDDPARLNAASALGAHSITLADKAQLKPFPIVADCSGDPERLAIALSLVGADGVCTPVWPYAGSIKLPVGAMFLRNAILVTGQPHARAHIEPILDLMQEATFSSTSIPAEILPWEQAHDTFGFGERKRIFIRS